MYKLLVSFLIGFCLLGGWVDGHAGIDEGLVGFWTFDGGLEDSSGYENHGDKKP